MISKSILNELGLSNIDKTLFKIPKKDNRENMPHIMVSEPNMINQVDILYLPDDKGYKFAVVCVDLCSKLTDAEPLKKRTADACLQGLLKIYKRKIIKMPKEIDCDMGLEFKGQFKKYFDDNNVKIRYCIAGRHRQMAMVENRNKIIGKVLFERMTAIESVTGQPSTEWTDILPKVIKLYNKTIPLRKPKKKITGFRCSGDSCNILDYGVKVLTQLDNPKEYINNAKLHGTFRASDIRWNPEITTIKDIILVPDQPPMYIVDRPEHVAYTRNQLQVVNKHYDEPEAEKLDIDNKDKTFIVTKLLERKNIRGKIYFLCKFKGYSKPSQTTRVELMKQQGTKNMVLEFEKSLK